MSLPQPPQGLNQPTKLKNEKTAKVAFAVSALFHVGILLLIGGVVLIPAVMRKDAFMAYKEAVQTSAVEEPLMETPVEDLPTLDAPADNIEPASGGNSVPQVDVVVVDSSRMTSPFVNTGNVSLDVTPLNFSKKGQGNQQGTGVGNAKGGGGGVMRGVSKMTLFGSTQKVEGNFLEGYLYDLKQSPDKKPTDMLIRNENDYISEEGAQNEAYKKVVSDYIKAGFRDSVLNKYYKASQPLYASSIFIPPMNASEAPKAFSVEKEVQPRRWIVHYQGKMVAPETGKYRFWGFADDMLIVAIDGNVVMNGCLHGSFLPDFSRDIPVDKNGQPIRIRRGVWKSLVKGQAYALDVAIGEMPGGTFTAFLLIEKEGEKYEIDPANGQPILPIFRLSNTKIKLTDDQTKYLPLKIAKDGPVFGNQ